MVQGQSAFTWFKQERFQPIFCQSLGISNGSAVRHFAYYHVDLNAGSGINAEVGVEGSPLNFLRAVQRMDRLNFYAFFVDRDPAAIRALVARPQLIAHANRVGVFPGDNGEILDVVREFVRSRERNPQFAMGSVLFDPNGYHNGVPWEQLSAFAREFPRFDIIGNLNVFTWTMERGQIQRGNGSWAEKKLRPVSSFGDLFNRPNWMITRPDGCGGHTWVQVVGRTIDRQQNNYRSIGFEDLAGPVGREIIERLEGDGDGLQLPLLP